MRRYWSTDEPLAEEREFLNSRDLVLEVRFEARAVRTPRSLMPGSEKHAIEVPRRMTPRDWRIVLSTPSRLKYQERAAVEKGSEALMV